MSNRILFDLERFIKVPFKDGGRDFSGADCWGLVMLIYREFGIELPDFKIACNESLKIHLAVEDCTARWPMLSVPVAPCIIVFRMSSRYPRICNHIGTYIGEGKFIHTLEKQGASVVQLNHSFFSKKIVGFYEYPEQ